MLDAVYNINYITNILVLGTKVYSLQVAPPGVKWMNHIHYTGSCIPLTFLFIKLATKRDLLVNPIAAGT